MNAAIDLLKSHAVVLRDLADQVFRAGAPETADALGADIVDVEKAVEILQQHLVEA